jgi:heavy metal sensor kinase
VALSLRSRLTIWYSTLLLLAIVLFSATVLSLYWRLVLEQSDESLEALSAAAANVVVGELAEHLTLAEAAREMESVVRQPDYVVAVIDPAGVATRQMPVALPPRPRAATGSSGVSVATARSGDGTQWRVALRGADWQGHSFTVAIAAPMHEVVEQWHTLVEACAIGVPFVLAIAAAGGWMLGRRGLRPLAEIATQARTITARAPESRLVVPDAGAELEDVAASFNRVLDRLGTALSTQRRFMADASHELRTPVSIMATAAEVTLSQPRRDEHEYRDALAVVAQQSSRLARLVDDMLVLARADAGGYPVNRAELDLDAVVDGCIRELAAQAAAKRIHVTSRLVPISVTADEALLRRMLLNLLGNALTYTPADGAVDVQIVPLDGAVSIHLADTGPGIALDDRERVFERFVRLDPARAQGGAGLGLSIARWVAEAHGGRVELLSSGPEGSVFAATIPA